MTFNQQPKPVINKLQLLAGVAVIAIVGGVAISITNSIATRSQQPEQTTVIKQSEITPQTQAITQPQLPSTQTQIIILTPNSPEQLDCLKFGGGLGCFDGNYQPDVPVHWADEKKEEPKRGEPRNVGIYKFW